MCIKSRRSVGHLFPATGVALMATGLMAAPTAAQPTPAASSPTAADYAEALAAIKALTAQVGDLKAQVQTLQARADHPTPPAPPIETIAAPPPAATKAAVDDKAFHFRGVSITPSGFLEAANQYRSRALGSDMFSPFGAIPFDNIRAGHESEDRFSARQSRFGLLVKGDYNASTHLAAYGEIDFLGAAQTANFTESNSFQPRLRHMYATVDFDHGGWHFLGGQTWTLATLNKDGITPRNEVIPATIDPQFAPGFVWARQPQFRIAKDFNKTVWLAVSLENPQTTFAGAVPPGVLSQVANSTGLFAGTVGGTAPPAAGGGAATVPTLATSSLNLYPDVIAKGAVELRAAGRPIHLEVFGLGRAFTDRVASHSETVYGGGVGFGLVADLVPHRLNFQLSALSGRGVGRYGTSGLPDVTFDPTGRIKPIQETAWLAGATLHATRALDVYVYGGEEFQDRRAYGNTYGVGLPNADLSGCAVEGGACTAATRYVVQGTIGFWQKFYEGPAGHMQVGLQYSYTERHAFSGLNGIAPMAAENIAFMSFRYYPLQ
jgi:hypothetical protein